MCLYLLFFEGHPDNYRDCSLLVIPLSDNNFSMLVSFVCLKNFKNSKMKQTIHQLWVLYIKFNLTYFCNSFHKKQCKPQKLQ